MVYPRIAPIMICIAIVISLILTGTLSLSANEDEENGILLVSIPGEALKASIVTYPQFLNKIAEYAGHDNPAIQYLSYPENYDIDVYDHTSRYIIRYTKKMNQYPGVKGGSIDYIVDKTSFKVIDARYYK